MEIPVNAEVTCAPVTASLVTGHTPERHLLDTDAKTGRYHICTLSLGPFCSLVMQKAPEPTPEWNADTSEYPEAAGAHHSTYDGVCNKSARKQPVPMADNGKAGAEETGDLGWGTLRCPALDPSTFLSP